MAGKEIGYRTEAITAITTTGLITLASVTGFYTGAIVWLNDSTATAGNNKRAIVTSIDTSAKTLGIRLQDIVAGSVPTYGNNNMTVYNGGTVHQHPQFIYNSNDLPLT